MMHEVTVRIVNVAESSKFGVSKTDHGQDYRPTLGKEPRPARGSAPMAEWVLAGAVPALLQWASEERAECVPTWVVLTCGCKEGDDIAAS